MAMSPLSSVAADSRITNSSANHQIPLAEVPTAQVDVIPDMAVEPPAASSTNAPETEQPTHPSPEPTPDTGTEPIAISETARTSARSSQAHSRTSQSADPKRLRTNGEQLSDGRVRNPVPPGLMGQADSRNGNFAVMGSFRAKRPVDQRNLAAQRSSEATQAAAAKAAEAFSKEGYRSWQSYRRRSDLLGDVDTSETHGSTAQSATLSQAASSIQSVQPARHDTNHSASASRPAPYGEQHMQGLPPHEVKLEQARLLTFLRGLHPLLVVDQLCKALAYFGSIPGAPPPKDHNGFPVSDKSNGSGAFFVSWLSEIFPPADAKSLSESLYQGAKTAELGEQIQVLGQSQAQSQSQSQGRDQSHIRAQAQGQNQIQSRTQAQSEANNVRRPRGRPRGSKAKKPRSDKGTKKGPRPLLNGGEPVAPSQIPEIIDLEVPERPPTDPTISQPDNETDTGDQTSQLAASPIRASEFVSNAVVEEPQSRPPGSRRRGRPKGSKNRPKSGFVDLTDARSGSDQTVPGPLDSPTQRLARAAVDISENQHRPLQTDTPTFHGLAANGEATLAQHARNWSGPPVQSFQVPVGGQPVGDVSRKRTLENQSERTGAPSITSAHTQQQIQSSQQSSSHDPPNKRSRVSKESRPSSTAQPQDSQSTSGTTSPGTNAAVPGQGLSASLNFDTSIQANLSQRQPPEHGSASVQAQLPHGHPRAISAQYIPLEADAQWQASSQQRASLPTVHQHRQTQHGQSQ